MKLTEHDKQKFYKMAEDCYRKGKQSAGLPYLIASTTRDDFNMTQGYFDKLQSGYCQWLAFGTISE